MLLNAAVEPMDTRQALFAAARLLSLGFPVIWLRSPKQTVRHTPKGPQDLPPERRGKAPVADGWASQDALTIENLMTMWGEGDPGYNIGIRTGLVAGARTCVIVVDLDSPAAAEWARANLPETQVRVRTAKGEHWYYRRPPQRVGNKVRIRIDGVDERLPLDIKGDGGLVVGPGSVHGTGHVYEEILPLTPDRVDSIPVFDPAWFGATAEWEGAEDRAVARGEERRPPRYVDFSLRRKRALAYLEATPGTVAGQGTASAECLYYARALVYGLCIPPEEAARILSQHEWNNRCTDSQGQPYPWALDELQHKCRDAYRLGFEKPYGWLLLQEKDPSKIESQPSAGQKLGKFVQEVAEQEAASLWWDFVVDEQEIEKPGEQNWPLTDTGNAERLVARFGEAVRFVEDRKIWMAWDQKTGRWAPRPIAIERCSKVVARKIDEEVPAAEERVASAMAASEAVSGMENEKDAKLKADAANEALQRLRKWQKSSESAGKRFAMIQLAGSEPSIAVGSDCFDRQMMLLNVKNGVLDLRKDEPKLIPHDRDYYLTKVCLVPWEPEAKAPIWERCLKQWMGGDEEMIAFLQRAAGYALTASVQEECFFVFCGGGSNGKSSFLNALAAVVGPYASTAPAGLLMETRVDKATPSQQAGLATLVGTRLVIASETDDAAHISEAQVKAITCKDRISAKRMYESPFEFTPTHHVFLTTNHKPSVSGTDDGIWRRIHLVEWTHRMVDCDRDNYLAEKLLAERPGILRWMVEGCREWKNIGLSPPPSVKEALQRYRQEQDTMGAFVAERLEMDVHGEIKKAQMRQAYEAWCDEQGNKPFGSKRFAQEMAKRNISEGRSSDSRSWTGVRFKNGNAQ